MPKPIIAKICGCKFINYPGATKAIILKMICNNLYNVTDVKILYKEECVLIEMWDCSEDNLRALQFLKEALWADYVVLY